VHLFSLTGFKNRVAVLGNWAIAFLGRGRPQRAITAQQVFGRLASDEQAAVITRDADAFRQERAPRDP
jgi:NADH dehydrogenase